MLILAPLHFQVLFNLYFEREIEDQARTRKPKQQKIHTPKGKNASSIYLLRPPRTRKKSIFVKKSKIEIRLWGDSPCSALSESL